MSHDSDVILLGVTGSSDRVVTQENADPASFPAGRAVRRTSAGALSLAVGDGSLIGVSLGVSLSDTKKTSVCRAGNDVPLEVSNYLVKAQLTFISKVTAAIAIEFTDTESAGSEEAVLTGDADAGYLISLGMDSTTSTTTQCKAALDGNADILALIETQIASGQGSTAVTAFAEDDIDSVTGVIGAAVRVSDVTGKAIPSGGTLTGATYRSAAKDGISYVDGSVLGKFAYIDMGGGL